MAFSCAIAYISVMQRSTAIPINFRLKLAIICIWFRSLHQWQATVTAAYCSSKQLLLFVFTLHWALHWTSKHTTLRPMLFYCCSTVYDAGPTLNQYLFIAFCSLHCLISHTQQTRHIHPLFDQCWPNVYDVGPTLVQHWVNVSCLLGGIVSLFDHWSGIPYHKWTPAIKVNHFPRRFS